MDNKEPFFNNTDRENERLRWNKSLVADSTYPFKKEANSFLAESVKGRKPGKALDVSMGQGRNALYLAKKGWDVTGYDIADEALAYARSEAFKSGVKLKTVHEGSEEFDFGADMWDLISFIYAGGIEEVPGLAARMKMGLRHGGLIVFEYFHRDAGISMGRNDFGCPTDAERNELLNIGGFKIIKYEEKSGIADYGLIECPLVYMIAERE